MTDVIAAALLGLSLGNVWICALVVFALQTSNRWVCSGYLVGRFIGILAFAIIFWLIGAIWKPPHGWLNIISAIAMLLFVAYFYLKYNAGKFPFWDKKRFVFQGPLLTPLPLSSIISPLPDPQTTGAACCGGSSSAG